MFEFFNSNSRKLKEGGMDMDDEIRFLEDAISKQHNIMSELNKVAEALNR